MDINVYTVKEVQILPFYKFITRFIDLICSCGNIL